MACLPLCGARWQSIGLRALQIKELADVDNALDRDRLVLPRRQELAQLQEVFELIFCPFWIQEVLPSKTKEAIVIVIVSCFARNRRDLKDMCISGSRMSYLNFFDVT